MLKRTALKEGKLFKALARDYYYEAPEATLSEALSNCKNWQKIMTSVNECAMIMQKIASEAIGSTTQAKAFLNLMSMTKKDSDLFAATQNLMSTVSAFAQMAKSETMIKEIVDYVFTNKKEMGGQKVKPLEEILNQLEAKKESLSIEFKVGKEGENVFVQVKKKTKSSPYAPKRAEMLNVAIEIIKGAVEQAGQKYSMAVQAVVELTSFLELVNSYSKTKPNSEERESMQNKMKSHPLWKQFEALISFPETSEAYEYTMDVKSPSTKVVSKLMELTKKVIAQAMGAMTSPVAVVDEWCIDLGEGFIEGADALLDTASEESDAEYSEPLALAASKKRKSVKVNRMDTDIEILENGVRVQTITTEQAAKALNLSLSDKGVHEIVKALNEKFKKEGTGKEAKIRTRMYDSKNKEIKAVSEKKDSDESSSKELEEEIEKGGEVESEEHDVSEEAGKKIAKDHLEEEAKNDPEDSDLDYYEELKEMEEELSEDEKDIEPLSEEKESKIRDWILKQKGKVSDEVFHTYLESIKVDPSQGEEVVYKFIRDLSKEVSDPLKVGMEASAKKRKAADSSSCDVRYKKESKEKKEEPIKKTALKRTFKKI